MTQLSLSVNLAPDAFILPFWLKFQISEQRTTKISLVYQMINIFWDFSDLVTIAWGQSQSGVIF